MNHQSFHTMNRIILGSLLLVFLAAWPSTAQAHASLDHAEPKVGATITNSPPEIKIWFTQELEPAFSTVEVRDSQNQQVDKKDAHLDAKDKSLLIVSLSTLPPGKYTVTWHVVSADTHKTQGHFEFTIE
jgi:methionine-rich copper-binding protein CopC